MVSPEKFYIAKLGRDGVGFLSTNWSPEQAQIFDTQVKQVVDYVSDVMYALPKTFPDQPLGKAAQETVRIMGEKESDLWWVGGEDLPYTARAAVIYPGRTTNAAYPTIVLNVDRLFPFNGSVPDGQFLEIVQAIGDFPGARKLLEIRNIRVLSTSEFLARLVGNPRAQRIVVVRDLMSS